MGTEPRRKDGRDAGRMATMPGKLVIFLTCSILNRLGSSHALHMHAQQVAGSLKEGQSRGRRRYWTLTRGGNRDIEKSLRMEGRMKTPCKEKNSRPTWLVDLLTPGTAAV